MDLSKLFSTLKAKASSSTRLSPLSPRSKRPLSFTTPERNHSFITAHSLDGRSYSFTGSANCYKGEVTGSSHSIQSGHLDETVEVKATNQSAPIGMVSSHLPTRLPRLNTPHHVASLTRMLCTSQPSTFLRSLSLHRNPGAHVSHGPVSVLLTFAALLATLVAALRQWCVCKVKGCRTCRGYGRIRCKVCGGQGIVEWAAKLEHTFSCPCCLNKRFTTCPDCGGHYHRPLFQHARSVTQESMGFS